MKPSNEYEILATLRLQLTNKDQRDHLIKYCMENRINYVIKSPVLVDINLHFWDMKTKVNLTNFIKKHRLI